MKAIFTSLVILFSFIYNITFAQISKGTWLIDGNVSAFMGISDDVNDYNFSAAPKIGYFLNDRLLIGTSAGFTKSFSESESPGFDFKFTSNSYNISPFIRYYFPVKNYDVLQYFLQTEFDAAFSQINTFTNNIESIDKNNDYILSFGGGLNYFIHQNIALEGILQYRSSFSEDNNQHHIIYNIGLQFFLPPSSDVQSLDESNAINKGTWLIGMGASGGLFNIGDGNNISTSFMPSAAYFISNRFAVGSSFQLAFSDQNAIVNPEPFIRYYMGKNGASWQPFATGGCGTRFQFADKFSESSFFGLNATAGLGLDIFITSNVALEGVFRYNTRQIEEEFTPEYLDFNIGFQFFLK